MSPQLPEAAAELLRTNLSVEQRLELIGHRAELKRRLAAADADPDAAIPWPEVKKRLSEEP